MTEFKSGDVALFKSWSGDEHPVRVTILRPMPWRGQTLNYRVRFEEACRYGLGWVAVPGVTEYTAGISQLVRA